MKNRIIYWGGKENTMIPRMGACGEGVDVESGGAGGSGGGPQSPAATVSAPDGPSLWDKLKGLLPALALGALALAAVAGAVIMLRKNRDGGAGGAGGGAGGGGAGDGLGSLSEWDDSLSDAENYANLGFDIEGARTANRSANIGLDGFNEDGLPIPPDFIGQQIIDEDGNLWVYKDPPGAWINFGDDFDAQHTTSGEGQTPIYESYVANVIDVINDTELIVDETWLDQSQRIGNFLSLIHI